MTDNVTFRIGDIGISFNGEPQIKPDEVKSAFRPFISTAKPDIQLRMHLGSPDISVGGYLTALRYGRSTDRVMN